MSALCPRPESQTRSAARVFRLRICSAELTGKQTTSKRTPDQKPHLFSFQERNQFAAPSSHCAPLACGTRKTRLLPAHSRMATRVCVQPTHSQLKA